MADLAPLGYGRVKARYVAGVADSSDAGDVPDVVPLTGTVTFNMSASALRVVTAAPDPATVHPRPITVALDDEGYLTQNGSRLVSLLATDDPATNPTGLQWTVSFNLRTIDGDSVPAQAWSFELPRGAVVDLTEVAPLTAPAPNTIILKGTKGDTGDKGDKGDQGLPGVVVDTTLAPVISSGAKTASALRASMVSARGAVVLIFDDNWADHYTDVAPLLEARGFRATFAVNPSTFGGGGRMTAAQVLDLYNRGHEIANHGQTHQDMTALATDALRAGEFDDAQAAIVALTGAPATTWVYPYNLTNAATDRLAYLRYDRVFAGTGSPYVEWLDDRGAFLHGRYSWSNDSASLQPRGLAFLDRVAREPIVFTIFTHKTNGETGSILLSQLIEFLDKCVALGIPVVPASKGFPTFNPLSDPGYTATDARFLSITGNSGANTYSKPANLTPPSGMTAKRALRLTNDGTATLRALHGDFITVRSPGAPQVISALMQQNRTSGGGSAVCALEYDSYGTALGSLVVGTTLSTSFSWTQQTMSYTPSAACTQYRIGVIQTTMVGTTDVWRMHIGDARRPALA
ncbi:hypothetical protein CSIV_14265 [Microbacterium sp. CSI-V]|uniref:polysaccharide deacetylase family protein n=1 Tax=Microbacterium sp. CSI-V TaxID=1933777 RepID=UPI00097CA87F|nr:polysaccharide deacetylase family protein [Microbacterium sp. CSI-V]ONI62635.1 hypothetical protein CSIV_14265 [Microbacterium sp. CSI-V]